MICGPTFQSLTNRPDRNPNNPDAAIKFKDISLAYAVLSNPIKRRLYDTFGEKSVLYADRDQGRGAAEDLFAQFFSGESTFAGGGLEATAQRGPPKARTIYHVHKVALEDIYRGKICKMALQKSIICPKCDGRGGKAGAIEECAGCEGYGMKTATRPMGPMSQRSQTVCPDCNGKGEIIRDKDKCEACDGKKTTIERKVIHVNVERGVKTGHKIEFRGEGDQILGIQTGDVVFEIDEKPHPLFHRKDDHLIYSADIGLGTARTGGTISIEHLSGRRLNVEILPGELLGPGKTLQSSLLIYN
jgi:DnaJ family protein A protein 2